MIFMDTLNGLVYVLEFGDNKIDFKVSILEYAIHWQDGKVMKRKTTNCGLFWASEKEH